jgi:hypothetical protein
MKLSAKRGRGSQHTLARAHTADMMMGKIVAGHKGYPRAAIFFKKGPSSAIVPCVGVSRIVPIASVGTWFVPLPVGATWSRVPAFPLLLGTFLCASHNFKFMQPTEAKPRQKLLNDSNCSGNPALPSHYRQFKLCAVPVHQQG